MKAESGIDPKILPDYLDYNRDTGILFWKERDVSGLTGHKLSRQVLWNRRYSGKPALDCISSTGAKHGGLFGKTMWAHRVVWAVVNGVWPENQIDHIDGNNQNNRIENLRDVPRLENMRNLGTQKRNKSGVMNVRYSPRDKAWIMSIGAINRRVKHCRTFEEAILARDEAIRDLGFHENHGKRMSTAAGRS